MVKELFLAILLGSLLGFGVTGGYIALSKTKTARPSAPSTDNLVLDPTPDPALGEPATTPNTSDSDTIVTSSADHKIEVTTPVNESIAAATKIDIKGTTTPNSLVVATITTNTQNTTADAEGNFQFKAFEIEAGINLIQLSAISPADQQADLELEVTYSSAKF